MIYVKTPEEIQLVKAACQLTSQTLAEVAKAIQPGVTTQHLDNIARQYIHDNGGIPACLGYQGFPAAICCEVNDIIVHGFPSSYQLKIGDIIGIDLVVELNGYMGDSCYTFPVGDLKDIDPKTLRLLQTTRQSLDTGIQACRAGHRIGDISNAIQTYCEHNGYTVVREMCGHGIGRHMHEDPEIPNYGRRGIGPVIRNGMCLCIEPMINLGSRNIRIDADGWTCRTKDGRPSAHYEHTVAIIDGETQVLTTFEPIRQVLQERYI